MILLILYFTKFFCVQTPNIFDKSDSLDDPDQLKEPDTVMIQPGNKIDIKPKTKEANELEIKNDTNQSKNVNIVGEQNDEIDAEVFDESDSSIQNELDEIARDAEKLSLKAKRLKNR